MRSLVQNGAHRHIWSSAATTLPPETVPMLGCGPERSRPTPRLMQLTVEFAQGDNCGMSVGVGRRIIGSLLGIGVAVMASSGCTSGALTMAEMACCTADHEQCEMAGHTESCCGTDLQSNLGMVAPERSDSAQTAPLTRELAATPPTASATPFAVQTSLRVRARAWLHNAGSSPGVLTTVLRI